METVFAAHFITPKNQMQLTNAFKNKDITRSPLSTPSFEVGNVIVTRRVTLDDPFDSLCFKSVNVSVWICSRSEFARTFDVVDDENRTETHALIVRK